jgi:hypothetical protein
VESLGAERIRALLATDLSTLLAALITRDLAAAPHFAALPEAGRLLRLTRDFGTLLRNFVNFEDFYAPDRPAIFQAGTLYLDTRSTQFCIYVEGATPLAAMSKAYIAYCDLRRAGSPPAKIAACFTRVTATTSSSAATVCSWIGRDGLATPRSPASSTTRSASGRRSPPRTRSSCG